MPRCLPFVLLIACSSPAPAREPAAQKPPTPRDAAVVTSAAPRIQRPTGCILRGAWKEQPRELRLAPDAKPYATVRDVTQAEATFADSVFVDVATPSLRLEGFVDHTRVIVHPTKPFVINGWLAPGPTAALQYRGEDGGVIAFELALPTGVKAKPVQSGRPCDELAIDDAAKFDPRTAIADATIDTGTLQANTPISLWIDPNQLSVAELNYDAPVAVDILERRPRHVRVAISATTLNPRDNIVVFGWVPSNRVKKDSTGFGGSWSSGDGTGAIAARPRKDTRFVSCPTEMPLVVDFDGQRRTVGAIVAKHAIEVLPGGDNFVEVLPHRAHAVLAEGARWLVQKAALDRCDVTTRP